MNKLIASLFLFAPKLVFAQGAFEEIDEGVCTDATARLLDIVDRIIDWTVGFVLVVGVLVIVYAAFLFLTSGGESEKISTARKYIVYVVVAIVVAVLSMLFVDLIAEILGYDVGNIAC